MRRQTFTIEIQYESDEEINPDLIVHYIAKMPEMEFCIITVYEEK